MKRLRSPVAHSLLVVLTSACSSLQPAAAGWSRETYREGRSRCTSGGCHEVLTAAGRSLLVSTRARQYSPHEIPGWDRGSRTGRALSAVSQWIIRSRGGTTDRVSIGVGTRVVTDTAAGGWRLSCAAFWIDDQEIERSEPQGDHVARLTRRTDGLDCRAVALADTGIVRWRFRRGIAPPVDSLAYVYDSLAAARSPMISAVPPMSLERLARDSRMATRYDVQKEAPAAVAKPTLAERVGLVTRMRVTREDGAPIATLFVGPEDVSPLVLDLGPSVSDEEARVLRLVAAALALPMRATR